MALIVFYLIIIAIPIIIIWNKSYKNSNKIDELKWELKALQKQISSSQQSKTETKKEIPPEKKTISIPTPTIPITETEPPVSLGEELFSFNSIKQESTTEIRTELITEKKSLTKNEWEVFVGGKVLNRIGSIALVIGLGYFLKYAFDNDLISETIRVLVGISIGILLIAGGVRFYQKDLKIFSQGLAGAGISILYLSIYASFNYYHLVSQPLAFGFMAIVTIITFIQAFYYDSLAVSLLGWAGGFLTPFLLSAGQANEVGLFTYIILLDIGLLIVVLKKDAWVILETLTVAGTYLIFYVWYDEYYTTEKLAVTLFFLSAFWLLFFLLNLSHVIKSIKTYIELRQIVSSINVAFYYLGLFLMIDNLYHEWMGFITVILSVIYFSAFFLLYRKQNIVSYQQIFSLLTAIILFTISILIQFEKFVIVIFWAFEALILLWLGIKSKVRIIWITGLVLTLITIIALLTIPDAFIYTPIEEFTPIFNIRTLSYVSITILFGTGAYLLSKSDINDNEQFLRTFNYAVCVILFVFFTVEISDYLQKLQLVEKYSNDQVSFLKLLCWSVGWTVLSMLFILFGYMKNVFEIIISGLFALGLGVLLSIVKGIAYVPIEQFSFMFNYRVFVLVSIIAGLTIHILLLQKYQDQYEWLNDIYKIFQVGIIIVVLSLVTGEIRDYYEKAILFLDNDSPEYLSKINLQQMILSGSWLLVSMILIIIGIWRRDQIIRITAIIIFGISILKIFLYDLSFLETLYRIFSFIGLGVILLIASYLYQKYKKIIL